MKPYIESIGALQNSGFWLVRAGFGATDYRAISLVALTLAMVLTISLVTAIYGVGRPSGSLLPEPHGYGRQRSILTRLFIELLATSACLLGFMVIYQEPSLQKRTRMLLNSLVLVNTEVCRFRRVVGTN